VLYDLPKSEYFGTKIQQKGTKKIWQVPKNGGVTMPKRIVPLTDMKVQKAKPKDKPVSLFDGGGLFFWSHLPAVSCEGKETCLRHISGNKPS
jgi:hypothetical protein